MAQLSLVIVPAKVLTSGKHKIRIAVSHNSETRYIVTDVVVDNTRQFRNGQVAGRPDANILNAKLQKLLNKYQAKMDNIEYIEGMNCTELVYSLKDSIDGKTSGIYTLDGRKIEKLQKGVNIVKMPDGHVKKVFVK